MTHTIENADMTLLKLMDRVSEQAARSQEFLAPTNQLRMETLSLPASDNIEPESRIIIEASKGMPTHILRTNQVCQEQIAEKAGIDARTARRFRTDYPEVYDHAINAIWQKEPGKQMIRAHMDDGAEHCGVARGFVSDRYKTFDHSHLLKAVLPALMDSDAQWRVVNADLTDQRMYLRLRSQVITADREENPAVNVHAGRDAQGNYKAIGKDTSKPATAFLEGAHREVGDVMALGIGISNSEVGRGSVQVYQQVWTLQCLNALQTDNRHRSTHLTGARGDADIVKYLTDEAINADNNALTLKLRDLVAAYASRELLDEVVEKMRAAARDEITGNLQGAVVNLGKVMKLTKTETDDVLEGLMATLQQPGYAGQKPSRATLVNACTRVAHKVEPDQVDDWQRRGGRVLTLGDADWELIAKAA